MNQAEITYDRIAPQLMSKSGIGFEWYQNIKLQEYLKLSVRDMLASEAPLNTAILPNVGIVTGTTQH